MAITVEMEIIAPDGASLTLDAAAGYFVTGMDDGGLPPLEVGRYSLPLQDGAVLSDITAQARPINVMVQVTGDDYAGMVSKVAALVDIVKPYRLKAPGAERYWILRRTVGANSADLRVVPAGLIKEGVRGMGRTMGIRLEALDPFWYGSAETTQDIIPAIEMDVARVIGRDSGQRVEPLGGGVVGTIYAIAENLITGDIYVGGDFTQSVSGVTLNYIGKWDGSAWQALGTGLNAPVRAMCFTGDDLLWVGGDFTPGYIQLWNETADVWILPDTGVDNKVWAIAAGETGHILVGGDFTTAGSGPTPADRIADFNYSAWSWSAIGSGMNALVRAVVYDPDAGLVYAGGDFTMAGGNAAARVAMWDGVKWSSMGAGMEDSVYALTVGGGALYAGGAFTNGGGIGVQAYGVALWDGASWYRFSTNLFTVRCMAYDSVSGRLYLGSGVPATYYVHEAQSIWVPMDQISEADAPVHALLVSRNLTLYAGGAFTTVDGIAVGNVFKRQQCGWYSLAGGVNGSVFALEIGPDGYLYAGGAFTLAGGASITRVARWLGDEWDDVSGGIDDGVVYAMRFGPDGTLYVGGSFTTIGGGGISRIAAWNGSAWSALGTGANGDVYALEVSDIGELYAGGAFTLAGGVANTNRIAKWDGSAWSALGTGMNGDVNALRYDSVTGLLYAGGVFTTAGGTSAARVARWNGSTWSALGTGMNGIVRALELAAGGLLYVGGDFTTAGGISAAYLAQWNGYNWSVPGGSAGTGLNNIVRKLRYAEDGTLYISGDFTAAGGLTLSDFVVRWNGYTYAALPFDLPAGGYVTAIAVDGSRVYLGGSFSGTASVAASTQIRNSGGLNSPVVFTISGPGTLISLRNESTSKEMWFSLWINAGETVTVNLVPGAIAITSDWRGRLEALPNSAFDLDLAADPVVDDGINVVSVYVQDATADTSVEVGFTPRWYDWENAVQ